jgi:hypothetical protein
VCCSSLGLFSGSHCKIWYESHEAVNDNPKYDENHLIFVNKKNILHVQLT